MKITLFASNQARGRAERKAAETPAAPFIRYKENYR
jgi:hypothetical protein